MDLNKELSIMVKYILPEEEQDKEIVEGYVKTFEFIFEEYAKQLKLTAISKKE